MAVGYFGGDSIGLPDREIMKDLVVLARKFVEAWVRDFLGDFVGPMVQDIDRNLIRAGTWLRVLLLTLLRKCLEWSLWMSLAKMLRARSGLLLGLMSLLKNMASR